MFGKLRRQWQLTRVRPGDGSPLPRYRPWQVLSRSLFVLDRQDAGDGPTVWAVDVRHGRDSSSSKRPAALYRDGTQVATANLPAMFPVPGGAIEVAVSQFGVKRMHFIGDDGTDQLLRPDPRSPEGLRARFDGRFPRASALVAGVSVAVLLVGLAHTLAVVAQQIARVPPVAERIGTVALPVLSGWPAIALTVAGALCAVERSHALRSHWLLRAGA